VDPARHALLIAAVTTGVGAVMIRLGLVRGMLESRRGVRRCPSCGRLLRERVCSKCAGSD
jgi:recombinational DNA repair protein RecR